MATLKQTVLNATRDAVVLNADNDLCVRLIGDYPVRRVMLFSLTEDNAVINLYSAVGKFSADERSRCVGVEIYSKYLETKKMRKNSQPVFGLKCWI